MTKQTEKKEDFRTQKMIENLAKYGLTNKEIAEALGMDENTMKRHFEIFLIKGRANLKERLRRKQIQVALGGNVSMLIWLGKQYLEQSDSIKETGELKVILERREVLTVIQEQKISEERVSA